MTSDQLTATIARCRKTLVAVVAAIAQVVALGVLEGDALKVATAVIAVATILGVYQTPNAQAPATATPIDGPVPPAAPPVADPLTRPGRVRRPRRARRIES